MKKALLTLFFVLATASIGSAQWTVGGGLYLTGGTGLGVNFYNSTENLYKNTRGGGDIVYYSANGVTNIEISANIHYFFLTNDQYNAYAIVGTTYISAFGNGAAASVSGILNLGAGAEYGLKFGKVFAEARYMILNATQLGLQAGVRITL